MSKVLVTEMVQKAQAIAESCKNPEQAQLALKYIELAKQHATALVMVDLPMFGFKDANQTLTWAQTRLAWFEDKLNTKWNF